MAYNMEFRKLTDQIGEEAMLSLCYEFMTFCVSRPTEEQRLVLEAKFEQDRYFESLRKILTDKTEIVTPPSPRAPFQEPVPVSPKPEAMPISPKPEEPEEPEEPNAQKVPKRAEKYWPFMRVKNVIKHLNLATGRFSYMKGLELLAASKNISVEQLLDTPPDAFVSHYAMKRVVGGWYPNYF